MKKRFVLSFGVMVFLSACGAEFTDEIPQTDHRNDPKTKGIGKLFGEESLKFGGKKKRHQEDTGITVNSYLWRASLDTVSFMPISSADPFGGVILTDWFSPGESPSERFKINIFILSRELRSDGLRVTLFRQEKDSSGQWVDQPVDPQTIVDLETTILTHARHFRSIAIK